MFNLKNENNNNPKELRQVICPECKNLSSINIMKDIIILDDCKEKHRNQFSNFKEFINTQFTDDSDIKCEICQNNKNDYNNKFYICMCGKELCPICSKLHNNQHTMIEYNNKYDYCNKHNKEYILFCKDCNEDLCYECEEEHKNHLFIYYKQINDEKRKNKIKNYIKSGKSEINMMKTEINDFIFYKIDL